MNKAELVEKVLLSEDVTTKAAAGRIVERVLEHISEQLEKGNEVRLAGFGNFSVQKKAARNGRNPQTGDTVKIPKKKVVKFKPAAALKTRVDY